MERHWRPLNVDFFIGFSEVQAWPIIVDFDDGSDSPRRSIRLGGL